MSRLRELLHRSVHRSHDQQNQAIEHQETPPPPPILPRNRPRRLSVYNTATVGSATSSFFQKLPPELRNAIYDQAFTVCRVHVELEYDHPPYPLPPNAVTFVDYWRYRDMSKPKQWRSCGGMCYTSPEGGAELNACRNGGVRNCFVMSRDPQKPVYLGVMGWILSCRQAYIETIELIYSVTAFNLPSTFMTHIFPSLILPERLVHITFLELIWTLPIMSSHAATSEAAGTEYIRLVSLIASSFPRLTRLRLYNDSGTPGNASATSLAVRLEAILLAPIDAFVRAAGPRLQELQYEVDAPAFNKLDELARLKDPNVVTKWYWAGGLMRFWRNVEAARDDGMDGSGAVPATLGYWIRHGHGGHRLGPRSFEH